MPSPYELKTSPTDDKRVKRTFKDLFDSSKEDRKLALETHQYFKAMVQENPQDSTAKGLMVDCLKLAQSAKQGTVKALEILVKMETAKEKIEKETTKGMPDDLYSQLDQLTEDK